VTERPTPFVFDEMGEAKRFAPATQRNGEPIIAVLADFLPTTGRVLEVASGTGEHIVHFATAFPKLQWQPSDYDAAGLASIAAWTADSGCNNILPPLQIDASAPNWPIEKADAIICINMIHIAPWAAAEGLFAAASRLLRSDGLLYLYGPYRETDVQTAESNEMFDRSLKERNADWGLRLLGDVVELAANNGFRLTGRIAMPANNLSLVFRKQT
jgi:SAM-dependent methyltransferase